MTDEGKYDNGPVTPANPKGWDPLDIHPRPGLPQEEVKSLVDMYFDAAYVSLQSAIERGDAEGYLKGLDKLAQLMRTEVNGYYAPPKFGDLPHTFMEWYRQNGSLYGAEADKIKGGMDVSILSNTLENHNNPHRDWPGDSTMSRNSESFGNAVAGYVNNRGHKFMTASIVPGLTDQNSEFMVQTIFKGFPKAPIAK